MEKAAKGLSRSERRQKRLANLRRRMAQYLPHRVARTHAAPVKEFDAMYVDLALCELDPTCPTLDPHYAELFASNFFSIISWWREQPMSVREKFIFQTAHDHAPVYR